MVLGDFVRQLRGLKGRTLVTFHALGDVDAVASAIAVSKLVSSPHVRSIDGVSASARRVLERLSLPLPKAIASAAEIASYDNVVLCDVSNPDLLGHYGGEFSRFKGKLFVLDHHLHSKILRANAGLVERSRSSCCEIVYELLKSAGVKIDERTALLLLSGILVDSAGFKSATKKTFEAFAHLLSHTRLSYYEVAALNSCEADLGERIARLKAVAGARFEREGKFLVCSSNSSAFELSCAEALVQAGCDVAFVANPKQGRMSGVKRETLLAPSVGKLMEKAGRSLGGSGGGHENVGGARGKPERVQAALEACVKTALSELSKQVRADERNGKGAGQ